MQKIKDTAIIILLIWVGWQSCGKKQGIIHEKNLIQSDTVIQIGAPVTNERYYTNIQPERVIEHHYHTEPIDTNAVVRDYFRTRHYRDSIVSDTASFYWSYLVTQNRADSFHVRTSYIPRTRIITNSYESNRQSIGLMALYASENTYIGVFGTWQNKRFSVSGGISPMNGGAFLLEVGIKVNRK